MAALSTPSDKFREVHFAAALLVFPVHLKLLAASLNTAFFALRLD